MKADRIEADQLIDTADWRPAYHFSPAMRLNRLGRRWPRLGELAECLDGWRVSANPSSLAYDPRLESTPIYRLRHVGDMQLETEAEHWQPPRIGGQPYCVQPFDVVVRKVGRVGAALVHELHRQHPVDANLAIIRGLDPARAMWVTYCLNQPLYRAFLESADAITTLVRVGLKRLADLPIAPMPEGFGALADACLETTADVTRTRDQLFRLRSEVDAWLRDSLAEHRAFLEQSVETRRWSWFGTLDLDDHLIITAAEQHRFARSLRAAGLGVPVAELARINPRHPRAERPSACRALRIGDVDDHFGIAPQLADRDAMAWRTQTRPVSRYDVLISTFATDSKVAWISDPVTECILPSEQLITLCFHRHPGAFALLMESVAVRAQWVRLATGSTQRFVSPGAVGQLVVPVPEPERAERWHQRLHDLLHKRGESERRLAELQARMHPLYRALHPFSTPRAGGGETRWEDAA